MKYYNPFQNDEIRVPNEFYDQLVKYTRTQRDEGRPSDPDHSPFNRYVDMWFLAFCLGVREGRITEVTSQNSRRFIFGSIFESDPERIELMELVALAESQGPEIVGNPRAVVAMANGFAATGFPLVLSLLESGQSLPIWSVTDGVEKMLRDAGFEVVEEH